MKFYNRDNELKDINKIINSKKSEFVYIYGRRRIWKTRLILESLNNEQKLYFFVWDKTEKELIGEFSEIIKSELWIWYINFDSFRNLIDFLFDYAKNNKLIVIFDEFQNFYKINKWIFSDFQYFWDLDKDNSNIKLFCLGSHFTLMKEIFENNKNPLFGRKTASFYLKNFDINTQVQILNDYKILSSKNLLYFYSIFAWIPKYIEIFLNEYEKNSSNKNFLDDILDIYIKENSFYLFEWKELFALEFGKSYDIYFGILSAIASWNTKKSLIADYTGIWIDSIWQYLNKLEKYFELIERIIPITDKTTSKNSRYIIKDWFLKFWFRYIFKYDYLFKIKDFDKLKNFIKTDINNFLWFVFEDLVKDILIEENLFWKLPFRFEKIWKYFDKKWFNEIDIVLLNSKEKKVMFIECKLNNDKIREIEYKKLKEKVKTTGIYKSYKKYYWFASVDDIGINCDYKISIQEFIKK